MNENQERMSRTSNRYVLAAKAAPESRDTATSSTSAPHRRKVGQLQLLGFGLITINVVVKGCGCQLSASWEAGAASHWRQQCVSARRKSSIDASYRKPRPLTTSRVRLSGTHSLNMTFALTMETIPQHWWKFECLAIEHCGLHQRNA